MTTWYDLVDAYLYDLNQPPLTAGEQRWLDERPDRQYAAAIAAQDVAIRRNVDDEKFMSFIQYLDEKIAYYGGDHFKADWAQLKLSTYGDVRLEAIKLLKGERNDNT